MLIQPKKFKERAYYHQSRSVEIINVLLVLGVDVNKDVLCATSEALFY